MDSFSAVGILEDIVLDFGWGWGYVESSLVEPWYRKWSQNV